MSSRSVQALVLSPTRELAAQTEQNILALGEFLKVQAHCCIGGKSLGATLAPPTAGNLGSPGNAVVKIGTGRGGGSWMGGSCSWSLCRGIWNQSWMLRLPRLQLPLLASWMLSIGKVADQR